MYTYIHIYLYTHVHIYTYILQHTATPHVVAGCGILLVSKLLLLCCSVSSYVAVCTCRGDWRGRKREVYIIRQLRVVWQCVCTGWPRLIGSPKLQITSHKRATKYRSLLQKMTYKDMSLRHPVYVSFSDYLAITPAHTHGNVRTHTAAQQHGLQHTKRYCNNIRRRRKYYTLQHAVTHCNTLQHTATHCNNIRRRRKYYTLQHTSTHCNTLQYTVTNCNTLQHIATTFAGAESTTPLIYSLHNIHPLHLWCHALQHTTAHCNTLQHTATHRNTLQHTTTHCNTLQHTATHRNTL